MIEFFTRRIFILRWQQARTSAARGNDRRAVTIFRSLTPPPNLVSICSAQMADSYFRLGRFTDAYSLYSSALRQEEQFTSRARSANGVYIMSYCQYYMNAIAEHQGADELPFAEHEVEAGLGNTSVNRRLREFHLPRP
ncbi:hypothetical protein [Roseovarius sp. 2305UL8-3]|uniref:hypothetical protein n=1 Tax=Roseovarius conchicola TaxID=3121636 RepID=UPI003529BC9F